MSDTHDPHDTHDASHQADPARRARLRWRARRGLLENDLIFERFFARYEHDLSDADVGALTRLLELSDNELMDLLLARAEPEGELATVEIVHLVHLLRTV
jgi:antitoxin CptB